MTTTTSADLDMLRARMAAAIGGRMASHIERLGWSAGQLAGLQRARLRALLARAIDHSPFHAARLAGIDPARFELADLARLPIMTKAQMMERFDEVVTDRRLTRDLVDQHIAASVAGAALLLGDYVCLVSGGSSSLRGVFVQTAGEYAEFAASLTRRAMAAFLAGGGRPADGMVIGIVAAASPVHSSGLAAATAAGPPLRLVSAPATWPTARIVERLNAAQPPALIGHASKLAELAAEQSAGTAAAAAAGRYLGLGDAHRGGSRGHQRRVRRPGDQHIRVHRGTRRPQRARRPGADLRERHLHRRMRRRGRPPGP
jgi:phenylacetate-CoA ligase